MASGQQESVVTEDDIKGYGKIMHLVSNPFQKEKSRSQGCKIGHGRGL